MSFLKKSPELAPLVFQDGLSDEVNAGFLLAEWDSKTEKVIYKFPQVAMTAEQAQTFLKNIRNKVKLGSL